MYGGAVWGGVRKMDFDSCRGKMSVSKCLLVNYGFVKRARCAAVQTALELFFARRMKLSFGRPRARLCAGGRTAERVETRVRGRPIIVPSDHARHGLTSAQCRVKVRCHLGAREIIPPLRKLPAISLHIKPTTDFHIRTQITIRAYFH